MEGGKSVNSTPRTDEQINGKPCTRFEILAGDSLRNASVPSEFARTIERELNAANDRIKRLEEELNELGSDEARLLNSNGELERRIRRLEEAGDVLCAAAAFMGWHMEIEKWRKAKEVKP
jgi:predicted  nucleic acid-binding Zn-ribbon protein